MKHQRGKGVFFICILLLTFSFVAKQETAAQSNQFILEKEQHWETYKVGGTCIAGTHNFFIADVDSDGVLEMITGGYMYYGHWNNATSRVAPLKIWNFNGQTLTLEENQTWPGSIGCVYAGDANGDGTTEILTAGNLRNSTGSYPVLRIWNWNGETLVLRGSYEGTSISSLSVSDVDNDGKPEIISVGRTSNTTQFCGRLRVWSWDGTSLTLKKSVDWGATNSTVANSVYVSDLDGDGVKEIITGGYTNTLKNSSGQLRVWQYNEGDISLKANEEWRLRNGYGLTIAGGVEGNTVVNNVKAGDVDGDGTPEIVTGGFTWDGEKTNAQLRIWSWNGQALTLEESQEWTTQDLVEVKSMSINDVDGDGKNEIVTSGVSALYGSFYSHKPEIAQLRVWKWDGTNLTLKQSSDWYIDEGTTTWNVAIGDVDKDGTVEIVTVGCSSFSDLCDPDMRIWSIAQEASTPYPWYTLWAILGILFVAIAVAMAFILIRKRHQKVSSPSNSAS